jgi:hypothetical protein
VTYTPTTNYCNNYLPADTFSYTLNGGSTASVSVVVNDASAAANHGQMPRLTTGTFLIQATTFTFHNTTQTRDINNLNSATENAISNSAPATFDAGNVVDPAGCGFFDTLRYHWVIVYHENQIAYTDSGITGYQTSQLAIAPLALVNEPVGVIITLSVSSTLTGLTTRYNITAQVTDSILTEDIYSQCQALPQGDPGCSIKAAGPALPGTT